MNADAMSLKAQIRNIAKKKNIKAQVLLQNYMLERFLERLSLSEYKDMFVIKGGTLIAESERLRQMWEKYRREFGYAANISYEAVLAALKDVCEVLSDISLP